MTRDQLGRAMYDAWLFAHGASPVYTLAPNGPDGPWHHLPEEERRAWSDAAVETASFAARRGFSLRPRVALDDCDRLRHEVANHMAGDCWLALSSLVYSNPPQVLLAVACALTEFFAGVARCER